LKPALGLQDQPGEMLFRLDQIGMIVGIALRQSSAMIMYITDG
jgi:hypothetical protein